MKRNHVEDQSSDDDEIYQQKNTKKKHDTLFCDICSKQYKNMITLRQHMKGHIARRKCELCYRSYVRLEDLRNHEKNVHGICINIKKENDHSSFSCSFCGKIFNQKSHLNRHESEVHGHVTVKQRRSQFSCLYCDQEFLEYSVLFQHVKENHDLNKQPELANTGTQTEQSVKDVVGINNQREQQQQQQQQCAENMSGRVNEGQDLSDTHVGDSGLLLEFECTPCAADGSKVEAVHFCQSCKDFLCTTCSKYHQQLMKTHPLVMPASAKQTYETDHVTLQVDAKCHYHPELDVEVYCGTHDMVYCDLCVTLEHRSCPNVSKIGSAEHTSNLSDLKKLEIDLTRVVQQLQDTKLVKANNLKAIKKKMADLLKAIKIIRKQMNDTLDELEQKITSELDEEQKGLEGEIETIMKSTDDLINVCNKHKPDLACDYDDKHKFIIDKLGRNVVSDAEVFLKKADLSKHPSLKFEPNNVLHNFIVQSDHIGKIVRSDSHSQPITTCTRDRHVKSQTENDCKVESDTFNCGISDVCQLSNGTVILLDYCNSKLKRLDNQFNVKDVFCLNTVPLAICSVSPTDVVVLLNNRTFQFVSVANSLSYQYDVCLDNLTCSICTGMIYCNDQIWMTVDGCIHIYKLSGSLVKILKMDRYGRELFPNHPPVHLAVSSDESRVYVAAWEDRVVVFNNNGDVINELHDKKLYGTSGVCVLEDNAVLVAGCDSKNVVMFDKDGNSHGELVTSEQIIFKPWSLCYNKKKYCLIVTCKSNTIQTFQLNV